MVIAIVVAAGAPSPVAAKPPSAPGGGGSGRAGVCATLFRETPPSTLVKRLVRQSAAPSAEGTYALTFELTGDRPDGIARVRDCVWADTNGNRAHDAGEAVSRFDEPVAFAGGRAEYTFAVAVAGGGTACGRASRRGLDGSAYDDRSNLLCTDVAAPEPPPTVPEVGTTALLPLAALPLLLIVARRQRRADTRAPVGSTRKEHR